MQKVLLYKNINEAAQYMHEKVFTYIREDQIESFESFDDFDLMAFDWYDVHSSRTDDSKILIYTDREDIFFFCEDDAALEEVNAIFAELTQEKVTNGALLYKFFVRLLKGDMAYLEQFEEEINEGESEILAGRQHESLEKIRAWRRELLRLKKYYEQLDTIFEELAANDNEMLFKSEQTRMNVLDSRVDRYISAVKNLQEVVSQMREAYQSQLSIQQNELMKLFTVVTVILLPLNLIAAWYGMNFAFMPELKWQYGYPAIIAASALIVAGLIVYFRRKRWF